jgi:hypothetical protein
MRQIILLICLVVSVSAGLVFAQSAGSPKLPEKGDHAGQPVIGPGVKHNIFSIEEVMREIHQLMFQGQFTPRQDTEVSEMMLRLGIMMQEMSGPQREKLARKHEQELKEIRRRIEVLRQQLKNGK